MSSHFTGAYKHILGLRLIGPQQKERLENKDLLICVKVVSDGETCEKRMGHVYL
jgi:hypothetical protein